MKIVLHSRTKRALLQQRNLAKQLRRLDSFQRFQAMLLLEQQDCESLAPVLGYSVRSLKDWLKLLIKHGPLGLWTKRRTGRPARLTDKDKSLLKQWVQQSPQDFGFCPEYWTAAMLQQVLEQHTGIRYAQGYICALLRSFGCSWYKQSVLPHKVDVMAQQEWIEKTLPALKAKASKENAAILYQDEVGFELATKGSYSWGNRRKPHAKPVGTGGCSRKVMGCIELGSGKLVWHLLPEPPKGQKHTHRDFLRFLQRVVQVYAGRKVYMVCDNGPIHHGPALRKWLPLHQEQLELVFLPAYSPKFNPIERLWRKIKRRYFHGQLLKTKTALVSQIRKALRYYQRQSAEVTSLMRSEMLVRPDIQALMAS